MQTIEVVTIIIAIGIVALPIILKVVNKKNKKDECSHRCDGCGKECPFKNLNEKIKID